MANRTHLDGFYDDFVARRGRRPRAIDMLEAGFGPEAVDWLGYVAARGGLEADEAQAFGQARELLNEIGTASMMRSYRMVVLRALLNLGGAPGAVELDALAAELARVARLDPRSCADIPADLDDLAAVRAFLLRYPVHYWGRWQERVFRVEGERWICDVPIEKRLRAPFVALMGELVDWRLEAFFRRGHFILKVEPGPRLLINRTNQAEMPRGRTALLIEEREREGDFRENELLVDELPSLLRRWFGPDAGESGLQRVTLRPAEPGLLRLDPVERL